MKAIRIVLKTLFWIIGILALLLLLHPFWIGPTVRTAANKIVPGITKTDFHLGQFALNLYKGYAIVGDLQLGNPEGYDEKNAVNLQYLDVRLAMADIITGKVHIKAINLDDLDVYASPSAGNFRQIAANASGKPVEAEDSESASAAEPEAPTAEAQLAEGEKSGGVVIDSIVLDRVTIKYGKLPIPLPTITLTDIGKDKENGASWSDVWQTVYSSVLKSTGALGDALGSVGKGALNVGKGAVDLGSKGLDGATDAVKNAGDALKGLFK